jgi:putative Holliday junction resolvase
MKLEQCIALDIGKTKTGIAKADPLGIVATPLKTVATLDLHHELIELQKLYDIIKLVIGLPTHMHGGEGEQAQHVRGVVDNILSANILSKDTEIIFEDEKLSSEAATAELKELGIRINKDNKNLVDSQAAALLLKQYFAKG